MENNNQQPATESTQTAAAVDTSTSANTAQTSSSNQTLLAGQTQSQDQSQAQTTQGQQGQTAQAAATETPTEVVYDLKSPEGFNLPGDYLDGIKSFAKEHKLTAEQAQSILNRESSLALKAVEAKNAQIGKWEDAVRNDKVLGGEKFKENMVIAKKGFDKVATPELRAILNQSGYGSHPEVVKLFHMIGSMMSDDSFHKGGQGGHSGQMTLGQALYG